MMYSLPVGEAWPDARKATGLANATAGGVVVSIGGCKKPEKDYSPIDLTLEQL